ncbi:NUDIX domain-containing protein [Halorubellus sp. PRR65]|uniref:NUDIX hydrolase n=1 Tax=Halorubellus sp. PRR65 TaxID=3098148 RepID=UPI002B25E251|nr:NUDIX domain-containing protein [Halorubellus sp. PRR65]
MNATDDDADDDGDGNADDGGAGADDGDHDRSWRDVRPMVLGLVWRDGNAPGEPAADEPELLVSRLGPFADDDEVFYRPPGGGVEFGETTAEAVVREFDEELDATMTVEGFLGVVENRFEFCGNRNHECCFAFEVAFADDARYDRRSMHGVEHDSDVTYETEWATLDDLEARDEPLYPGGLRELLETDATRVAPPAE